MDLYNEDSAFVQDDELYGKKITSSLPPERKKDVDLDKTLYQNIIGAADASSLDLTAFNSLTNTANNRNELYNMIDSMCDDGTISAVVETYAEDSTERNDHGNIVWAESDDKEIVQYVTFLLDSMNINKNIFKWVFALCKYGDVYLRLYRDSEYNDVLFGDKKPLNEDIKLNDYKKSDHYALYMEMISNPAEMFELTRFGKTVGYIKAPISGGVVKQDILTQYMNFTYNFMKEDVEVYPATEFVHAALEDGVSREDETVNIFLDKDAMDNNKANGTYKVRRGNSLLTSTFPIWRHLKLLEASVLLNRLTKSSIVRMINIEVGDMPKEDVTKVLMDVKRLIEQKTALNKGTGMQEYTNPGPIENNVYVPVHGGVGQITTSQIGGDVDVKSLADLEYYQNLLYGALRTPKQYFSQTNDSTGFNGGSSLTIISSRYAKMVKRIQNTIIQALTDAVNLMCIDKGLDNYVNKFTLHMVIPTTQEEIDRRDNLSNKVQLVSDIMNMMSDIDDVPTKLKVLKTLLANTIDDPDVVALLQEYIEKLEEENNVEDTTPSEDTTDTAEDININVSGGAPRSFNDTFGTELSSDNTEDNSENSEETILPSPADLGIDMSDSQASEES